MEALTDKPNARVLSLRFTGEAIRDHSISVGLFAKKVVAAQGLLIHLAESRLDKQPRARGRSSKAIAAECELFLRPLMPGSVALELTLPPKEETLFPELPDFAEQVLADARDTLGYFAIADVDALTHLVPNATHRKHVLTDLTVMAPSDRSDLSVDFSGNDGKERRLVRPARKRLREWLAHADESAIPVVKEAQFVEAKGMAVLRGGEILEWKETYDLLELDLESAWRPKRIEWGDCHLELRHPIAVTIEEREKDLWIASHDNLCISAAAISEDKAREAFAQEFVILWCEIAQELDENLTADALALKTKLVDLIIQPTLL